MPRRTYLDTGKRDTLLNLVRAGNHYIVAMNAAGVAESTFYQYLSFGRAHLDWQARVDAWNADLEDLADGEASPDPEPAHPNPGRAEFYAVCAEFVLDITRAEQEAEARLVSLWTKAAGDDWRAARDFLARRFPDRWKERQETTISGGDIPVAVSVGGHVTLPKLDDVMAALIEAGAIPQADVDGD